MEGLIVFTYLNKACPKNYFLLPRVDQLVDSTANHQLLSFMDTYSGYNKIKMNEADQPKTSFITNKGLYCYIVIPFGLKNARATYQRLVNMMFARQFGRTMEVYIDDMLVKSKEAANHIIHLKESFNILRTYKMRLNPKKCAFSVAFGKFLGFMVYQKGIEANPEKIIAVLEMTSPKSIKDVECLTGRIVALNFREQQISVSFSLRERQFQWTEECERAF